MSPLPEGQNEPVTIPTREQSLVKNNLLPAGAGINRIFDVFYELNPALNYAHGGGRKAAEFLAARFGMDGAVELAKYACLVQGKQFAPVITTPWQLKEKMAQLEIYRQKNGGAKIESESDKAKKAEREKYDEEFYNKNGYYPLK